MSPGRKPSRSPASTAGRDRIEAVDGAALEHAPRHRRRRDRSCRCRPGRCRRSARRGRRRGYRRPASACGPGRCGGASRSRPWRAGPSARASAGSAAPPPPRPCGSRRRRRPGRGHGPPAGGRRGCRARGGRGCRPPAVPRMVTWLPRAAASTPSRCSIMREVLVELAEERRDQPVVVEGDDDMGAVAGERGSAVFGGRDGARLKRRPPPATRRWCAGTRR